MFTLQSPAFADRGTIPVRYTADGDDISPPLSWSDVPPGTKSLVLIVEDPDAPNPTHPTMTWVHWIAVDIPPDSDHLDTDASLHAMPHGSREGRNDWRGVGYRGPAPPVGRHRYVHRLIALDCTLAQLAHPTKAEVERAVRGHELGVATLTAVYGRS